MVKKKAGYSYKELGQFETFKKIVEKLRSPDGCPWDRKQTHDSLKQYLVEECYEVLETIEENTPSALGEELGDLWLQIMLHTQIAEECGEFTMEDVIRQINSKLIHRHPHVFGDSRAIDACEASLNWQELKGQEKPESQSILSGVPKNLPALAFSQSIQRRAAAVGFDWKELDDVIGKLTEEIEELRQAESQEQRVEEFGDILFTLSNIARHMDIELESALRQTNARFSRRFNYIEETCRRKDTDLRTLSLEEMDALWNEAKTVK
ncbi:MAG: nucleoside triphosphate pyrophosphohydrolase [Dehalococcoidia bacterium]|nr:nucleoside triphosphate pyrophosphohydrolase [Dehalococcoidia bacterium]MDD5493576.1 nucleoside triphosphate pyrophosphohydrolase [Dehalococcoidia bacterium]